ncbi:hypothetical protein OESDEN_15657 [Oesophagostomum dentatum]|uniref:Uncharacterized protein n=1 Tax=Oesophagostomum dentatum TaxID=61180 RepID=A0A0B1SMC1_OESDE|nr:hypothetical protein OESDEN_15657 [Oesophagostomum dentatum]
MSDTSDFVQKLANEAKDMDEADKQKMSDTGRAVMNAAQESDATESLTNKLVQAKNYVSDKTEEAKKFVEKKLEDMKGQ